MICVVVSCAESEIENILTRAAIVDLAGVEEGPGWLKLWITEEGDAVELQARLDGWPTALERAADRNWNEAWQREWRPIEVGERFYLVPPSGADPTPPGRIRLAMHPGTAFGNGDHATTHLCLMAMERHLRPGDTFLDIGCGSGLLGEAALALSAGGVAGCDIDAAAVRPGHAFVGSVDAVRSRSCDFVVANIQLGVLLELLPGIARVLRPGGHAALSGVLDEQAARLRDAALATGLTTVSTASRAGWACLLCARPGAAD